jgi:vancomycin resistance protein YoaR
MRKSWIIAAAAVALGALVAGAVLGLMGGDTICQGVRAAGVDLGGLTMEQASGRLAERAAQAEKAEVTLRYADETLKATVGELGGRMDVAACVQAAYRVGREENLFRRIGALVSARRHGIDVPTIYTFDRKSSSGFLHALAGKIDRHPVNAKLMVESGSVRIVPEKPGIKLDVDKSLAGIESVINSGAGLVNLVVVTDEPKIKSADLQGIDDVIASYSTPYKPWQRDRTHNMRIACSFIDGTLLRPGEVFSYNEIVGPRLKKYGFRDAPIFVNGEVEPGTGGGVCQVSTTIYNTALLANLKVLRRSHHSRPVVYAPVGRDATVAPSVDLKFENTTGSPIYLKAWVGERTVNVSALGRKKPDQEVEIVTAGHKVIGRPVEEKIDENLEPGKRKVVEEGLSGHRVSTYRVVKVGGKVVKRELISNDYYRPQPRVIAISKPAPPQPPSDQETQPPG